MFEDIRYWFDGIDWAGVAIVGLFVLVAVLIVLVIANAVTAQPTQVTGTIVDKNYHAGYTTYIAQKVGSVTVMTPIYNPPSWSMRVKTGDKTVNVEVSSGMYDDMHIGQPFDLQCKEGGIFHDLNCEQ